MRIKSVARLRLILILMMIPAVALLWIANLKDEREMVPAPVRPPLITAPVPARGPQPQAELASYISQVDYPPAALQAREQGGVGFILTIGADGGVTGCQVTESSGSAALDGATCRIMQSRARYAPARDGNGRPIAGTDVGQVRWALP